MVVDQAESRRWHLVALLDGQKYAGQDPGSNWLQRQHHGRDFGKGRVQGMQLALTEHGSARPLVTAIYRESEKGARNLAPLFLSRDYRCKLRGGISVDKPKPFRIRLTV